MTAYTPEVMERRKHHDNFIHIVETLDEALDLLKAVYLAMGNPERDQVFSGDPLRDVVIRAIDKAEAAVDFANEKSTEIWNEGLM